MINSTLKNLSRYDNCKDSEVAKNWEIKRIKDCLINIGGGKYGKEIGVLKIVVPCFSISDFKNGNLYTNKFIKMKRSYDAETILQKGTILVEKSGGGDKIPVGRTVLVKKSIKAYYTNFVIGLLPKGDSIYFQYVLNNIHSNKLHLPYVKQNTGLQNFDYNSFSNHHYLALPPKPIQTAIATFLDKKTTLINKKRSILARRKKLILELEKSLINQVVTKGLQSFNLDPSGKKIDFDNERGLGKKEFEAYMKECGYKDSGVEWIGYVCDSWSVKKYKNFFKSSMGSTILKENLIESGSFPVYSATKEDNFFGYVNNTKLKLNKGDLVIPARGNSIGFVKLVKNISTATQTTIASKTLNKINSTFTYYFLQGNKSEIFRFDTTAIPQYTVQDLEKQYLLEPSKKEQKQIATFLDKKTTQFKKQIEAIDKEDKLLEEYRKTIINDVVTGKIKVTK